MENPIHSVSLCDFDIQIGNTLSQSWPKEPDFSEIVQSNLHDMCFPDGAHETHKDTVYAILDTKQGDHLYAVGGYRALKTATAQRGAVQRGILIISKVPLFRTITDIIHKLLEWWLCCGPNVRDDGTLVDDADWVEVLPDAPTNTVLSGLPRNPTKLEDLEFLENLYTSLSEGFSKAHDGDRSLIVPYSFKMEELEISTELLAPVFGLPKSSLKSEAKLATLSDALSYGSCLRKLLSTFKADTAKIYTALLNRQTICFVDHGNAAEVGMCVLATCHLIRPLTLKASEVVPYFTVTDASKIEGLGFCVCGATNPFYEDPGRNKWATLICSLRTKTVYANQQLSVPKAVTRVVTHVVQGILKENRTEAWIRNFFEWNTARSLLSDIQNGNNTPIGCELTQEDLFECISATENITATITKCHEVNKQKTAIHADWFQAMIDVLKGVAQRSEKPQNDMYLQISGYQLCEELGGFDDITTTGCGSRTVRSAIAQLYYEESKTRRLLTELRERIYLLIDDLNVSNDSALHSDDNKIFTDTFNTSQYQLYNLTNQVLLHSATCTVESFSSDDGGATVRKEKASGKLWVSKNYLCFTASLFSRIGKNTSLEVIPFDLITSVEKSDLHNEGIRLCVRDDGRDAEVHISSVSDYYRMLTLLETLTEKQKRTILLLNALDPVIAVPDNPHNSPLNVTCRLVVPCGLYLHDRRITEQIWESQRCYPVAGWSSKLMPHDPPSFGDRSGKRERRFTGKNEVTLPPGWDWLSDWTPCPWEYSSDFKKPLKEWKSLKSKFDVCRRRQWTRTRRLARDVYGAPLPVMVNNNGSAFGGGIPLADEPLGEPAKLAAGKLAANGGSDTEKHEDPEPTPTQSPRSETASEIPGGSFEARCRQTAPVTRPEISPVISPHDFAPTAVLPPPEELSGVKLGDFTSEDGALNPYHPNSPVPATAFTKIVDSEKVPVDALMAEANGCDVRTEGKAKRRDRLVALKNEFKNDLKELKSDLISHGHAPSSPAPMSVSKGVVMMDSTELSKSFSSPSGRDYTWDPASPVSDSTEGSPTYSPEQKSKRRSTLVGSFKQFVGRTPKMAPPPPPLC
eukprot:TRINITY_DN9443_c1_g1_i1.p1 TRINITY_DN9443_c1_g1~~TRINITY_DN9443_c1_g1_i1.p1  ORF type:complete len:1084 (+),score=187.65 TRINITY_DN9443_c1_g1_i1:115-3366(+)